MIMNFTNLFAPNTMPMAQDIDERIDRAREIIESADCILIGAGSGLSAAAGMDYGGEEFKRLFRPWIDAYGITDLYSSSFYPFATDEELWAYWAMHIWFVRYRIGPAPLYAKLRRLLDGKDYFVITTNVDGQFLKADFDPKRLFYTQGDYAFFQDAEGEDKHLYYNKEQVLAMKSNVKDCRIPAAMVPRDPLNGNKMSVNLRCDDSFVEDKGWHEMCSRYEDFVSHASTRRLALLEFGIGFNTPVIIRFPFERMAAEFPHASLVRFNRDYPQTTIARPRRLVSFQETLNERLLEQVMCGRG